MNTPREVVEDIRRGKFRIGLPPDASTAAVFSDLNSALELLSRDLYSKDIHFVLELVQNADDNSYPRGVAPALRFVLSDERLVIRNNEDGFDEANVRSLCSVGKSTKRKADGYIGEKGIGFKSVFRVSDDPAIFSNGYRFRLPRHSLETNLGYIVPVWCDDLPDYVDARCTNIVLPLRAGGRPELNKLYEVDPTLLLFLKQLRTLVVEDAETGRTIEAARHDANGTVELRSGAGSQWWRLAKVALAVPCDLREEKRTGVAVSELVLAFPLTAEGEPDVCRECPVFAYLPIRQYGFRFAIQADFLLASSREGIQHGPPWNTWLRDSIPALFLQAVDEFKGDAKLRTRYLHYVPQPGQVKDPFFAPVPGEIVERLKASDCILTDSGQWAMPSETYRVDPAVRSLLSNDDCRRLLGKEFVSEQFEAPDAALRLLGVCRFGPQELLKCLANDEWVAEHPDDWLVRLYAYLHAPVYQAFAAELRRLRILRLESGKTASAGDRPVFFPLSSRRRYGFEGDLLVLRQSLLAVADQGAGEAARAFLRSIGVKRADPAEVVREMILPVFRDTDGVSGWKTKDEDFLVGCVEYVKDHIELVSKDRALFDRLGLDLWIKCRSRAGNVYAKPHDLYLPRTYTGAAGLEKLFRQVEGIHFVDPAYINRTLSRLAKLQKKQTSRGKRARKQMAQREWAHFFRQVGIEIRVRVRRTNAEPLGADYDSPHLKLVLGRRDVDQGLMAFQILDEHWDYYRRHLHVRVGTKKHQYDQPTPFHRLLSETEWVPTKSGGLCKPAAVFIDNPTTRSLLGDGVEYLATAARDGRIAGDLGMSQGPTIQAVLHSIGQLVRSDTRDADTFRACYRFLDHNFATAADTIRTAFKVRELVFIPQCPTPYFRAGRLLWQDASKIFGPRRGYLSKAWPEFKRFFVEKLWVTELPAAEDYTALLRELSDQPTISPADERSVWAIYSWLESFWTQQVGLGEDDKPYWWDGFITEDVFWTDKNEFWSNDGDLFVNDRDDLYEVFRACPEVAFIKLPGNQYPRFLSFTRAAKIPNLSASARVAAVFPVDAIADEDLTRLAGQAVGFVIRYLYFREPDVHRGLVASGVIGLIGDIAVHRCAGLRVAWRVGTAQVETHESSAAVLPNVYVCGSTRNVLDLLGQALASGLGYPAVDAFVSLLLSRQTVEGMEDLMRSRRIPLLVRVEPGLDDEDARHTDDEDTRDETEFSGAETAVDQSVSGSDTSLVGHQIEAAAPDAETAPRPHKSTSQSRVPTRKLPSVASTLQVGSRPMLLPDQCGSDTGSLPPVATESRQQGAELAPRPYESIPPAERSSNVSTRGGEWVQECLPAEANKSYSMAEPTPPVLVFVEPPVVGSTSNRGDREDPGVEEEADATPTGRDVRAIGSWGEAYVVECQRDELIRRFPDASIVETELGFRFERGSEVVAAVVWLNRHGERGQACDILVTLGSVRTCVEVKSTANDDRAEFEMSGGQWSLARAEGPGFLLARVYNAGLNHARVSYLPDPYQAWRDGKLMATPVRVIV